MTKLPENSVILDLYKAGLSDAEIGDMYGATSAAVNYRLNLLGIERKPQSNLATAILEAAWPSAETVRTKFTNRTKARRLFAFMRWRLGDETLTAQQLDAAQRFMAYIVQYEVVLDLDGTQEGNPWVWLPRLPEDGRLVIRWPADREMPKGPHLEAISLPAPGSNGDGPGASR
ncbi:hypothetical protein [Streptomyces sp. NPDC048489]|uniref:hypothetical protein n=1 Tax=Streptomyces sp. NPDC048489 TaxID=3154504 RepID=UPI003423D502